MPGKTGLERRIWTRNTVPGSAYFRKVGGPMPPFRKCTGVEVDVHLRMTDKQFADVFAISQCRGSRMC